MSFADISDRSGRARSVFFGLKLSELFSVGGRLRRSEYAIMFLSYLGLLLIWLLVSGLSGAAFGNEGEQPTGLRNMIALILAFTSSILGFGFLVGLLILFAASAKRAHDLNVSAWILLLKFIPVVNLGLLFFLLFVVGTHGKNDYGYDPKIGPEPEPEWLV